MTLSVDLTGRRLLIVGASSGIGRSTALNAAAAGAQIAVVGRRAALLDEVVAAAGGGIAVSADIQDAEQCRQMVDTAVDGLGGPLDAVLFPVGVSLLQMLAKSDKEVWLRSFATNVLAPTLITSAALAAMAPDGVFLYVSSEGVARPVHGLGAYGASKAALNHSIRTWRLEHPDRRFMCLTVGATMPTDVHRDFPMDMITEILPLWQSSGLIPAEYMHPDAVGQAIVELVAVALAHPDIGLTDLEFSPPGAPQTAEQIADLVATGLPGQTASPAS
jgi:NAD(P)-dependent dehydrogenase (short-subunit alcohol dehydrogenase family)